MWPIIFFLLHIFLVPYAGADCQPGRCRKDGPDIRFPFRIINRHPPNCGYPSFDVYCNDYEAMLHSANLTVKIINYLSQEIQLSDPEKCLPQKLWRLNLTAATPFNFSTSRYNSLNDYILFNCSSSAPKGNSSYPISCLSDSRYHFFALESDTNMHDKPLTSCIRSHDIISSVPRDIFSQNDVVLTWSEPACGSCEGGGGRCAPPRNLTTEFGCTCRDTTLLIIGSKNIVSLLRECLFLIEVLVLVRKLDWGEKYE
ncbi:hypothetical protein C2S51_029767 [Perilla frutescens var. frutescens]|nr:hypothetical protein C2S51_029767 [Perilla frutescens var. frutescens]